MAGPEQGFQGFNGSPNAQGIALLQELVKAVNALNETIALVFPQIIATSATAGASSGRYGIAVCDDGITRKFELFDEA